MILINIIYCHALPTEEPFFRLNGQGGDIVIAGTALHAQVGTEYLFICTASCLSLPGSWDSNTAQLASYTLPTTHYTIRTGYQPAQMIQYIRLDIHTVEDCMSVQLKLTTLNYSHSGAVHLHVSRCCTLMLHYVRLYDTGVACCRALSSSSQTSFLRCVNLPAHIAAPTSWRNNTCYCL